MFKWRVNVSGSRLINSAKSFNNICPNFPWVSFDSKFFKMFLINPCVCLYRDSKQNNMFDNGNMESFYKKSLMHFQLFRLGLMSPAFPETLE